MQNLITIRVTDKLTRRLRKILQEMRHMEKIYSNNLDTYSEFVDYIEYKKSFMLGEMLYTKCYNSNKVVTLLVNKNIRFLYSNPYSFGGVQRLERYRDREVSEELEIIADMLENQLIHVNMKTYKVLECLG